MTRRSDRAIRTECAAATQRVSAAMARAQSQQSAALRAECQQARRQSRVIIEERIAILDAAVEIMADLRAHWPTRARTARVGEVTTGERGSSGAELTVRLEGGPRPCAGRTIGRCRLAASCATRSHMSGAIDRPPAYARRRTGALGTRSGC